MGLNMNYLLTVSGCMKIIELVCVSIAFGVLRGTGVAFDIDAAYIGIGVMFTCLLVTPLLLICYLMGRMEIQQTILEFALNFLMFFFLTVFGIMGFDTVHDLPKGKWRDSTLSMSFFALAAALAYLVDTVMAIINFRKSA